MIKRLFKRTKIDNNFRDISQNEIPEKAILIDCRTPEEFSEKNIEGAINIDIMALDFLNEISSLDKMETYVVYCRTGGRSRRAVDLMQSLGFREAYNLKGGIVAYKE